MTDRPPDGSGAGAERARSTPAGPNRRPEPALTRKKPGYLPTVLLGLASFAVLFEFLAFQLQSGNDPALGQSALAANDPKAARTTRPLIHRRIIKTQVVHLPPKATAAGTLSAPPSAPATAVPTPSPTPAPVTSSS